MSKPVIVGAGLAGLSVALALAPTPCLVISPRKLGEGCSSAWAQGGIAAAVGPDDSAALHAKDTIDAGAGLNDAKIVNQVTNDGIGVIGRLIARGVAFDCQSDGSFRLGLEAAHGRRRIVHATDATGRVVMESMIKAARAIPSIEIIEDASVQDLLTDGSSITGLVIKRKDYATVCHTNTVILACGGASALWRDTTNPHENWGGGLALAARAGAILSDLEFMQFHPTAIDIGRDPMPLASEALRGEGAILIDETENRFTDELQPRDIVARAIFKHLSEGHRVFLDARQALGPKFQARFPTIHALCASGNIDVSTMPIPVRPAAHYHMGGVATDAKGRTNVEGLWACGEIASTGLHGANRLASNSLLEAASFGQTVADDVRKIKITGAGFGTGVPLRTTIPSIETQNQIRTYMAEACGVVRSELLLERAQSYLIPLAPQSDMALVAMMVVTSALQRQESRGAHYRSDFQLTKSEGVRSSFRLSDQKHLLERSSHAA